VQAVRALLETVFEPVAVVVDPVPPRLQVEPVVMEHNPDQVLPLQVQVELEV